MSFHNRNLHMLKNWEPDSTFDPAIDRLLVTTDWDDTFVAYWHKNAIGEQGHLAIDKDFLPENLQELPLALKLYHGLPADDNWHVFIYDGDLTASGPRLDITAIGSGWSWSIGTSLGIADIEPVTLDQIDPTKVSPILGGIYMRSEQVRIMRSEYDKRLSAA
ncbi:MAG: hypothetical protein ACREGE_03705 [Candidatus Microsaccharimonas sp.]